MRSEEIIDLKTILLDSLTKSNEFTVLKIPLSRYRMILSQYFTLKMINVEGLIDKYTNYYDYYVISNLKELRKDKINDGNTYKIIVDRSIEEVKGRCIKCEKKRILNSEKECYVCISTTNGSYTQPIKLTK